jgi:hypothetical protein
MVMFDDLIGKTDNKKLLVLEKTIEEGLRTFNVVGSALLIIRDEKLYRGEYKTFEEYCDKKWDMDHSHAYRLMKSAQVVENLKSSPIGELLPANEAQTRPLALLTPEQQVQAWQEATEKASDGKQPTGQLLKRIAVRIRAKTGEEERMIKASKGWAHEELKTDEELMESFKAIAAVYGNEDAKAIRTGIIQLKRADVIFLAKLPKEKMLEMQDLIMANRWTPARALKFLSKMPDDDTTISELKNYCIAAKGDYKADFGGFKLTMTYKKRD